MNHMETQPKPLTTVYFDGLCLLCSGEIAHYRRQQGAENLRFVDITSLDFDPLLEGVDPYKVHSVMHVRRDDGTLALEVDAFIEIWNQLPRYHFLSKLAAKKWIRPVLNLGYSLFAAIRPYLPRRAHTCDASPYCELHK